MKRFLSTLLVAMLIVSCLATAAFAAGSATVKAGTVKGTPGSQVTVTFTVKSKIDGEFASYELYLKYDPALKLISEVNKNQTAINGSGVVANENPASDRFGKVTFASSKNVSEHTFTVTFLVPADAECEKEFAVSADLTNGFVADANGVNQSVSVQAGKVTIQHKEGKGVETAKPNCGVPGEMSFYCQYCGKLMRKETIPATGNHTWGEGVITKNPECGKPGEKTYTCSVCHATKTELVAALEHQWDNGVVTKKPDCVNPGEMTYTCSVCNETKTEPIEALGHDWETTYKFDDHNHWLECTRCDATDKMEEHIYKGKPVKNGDWYYHDCAVCDYVLKTSAPTGDHEIMIIVGIAAMSAVLAAAAFVCKRKFIG